MIIKHEADTDPRYGRAPDQRSLEMRIKSGLIILDKPAGPTSHEVARRVKEILQDFHPEKVGHGGTLDPNAMGVLPLTLNNATCIQDVLLRGRKEYVGTMHLHGDVDEDMIQVTLVGFQGEVWQKPPSRSAIKREWRVRTIDYIEVLAIRGRDVQFKVGCQAGTYIRTLAVDVGAALGCGAHLTALRRTRSGSFSEDSGVTTLEDIEIAVRANAESNDSSLLLQIIRPIESAFAQFRRVVVMDEVIHKICLGASVPARYIAQLDPSIQAREEIAIFSLKGEIIARGVTLAGAGEIKAATKGYLVRTRKVYMDPDVYPELRK